jgi:hypothetical protein
MTAAPNKQQKHNFKVQLYHNAAFAYLHRLLVQREKMLLALYLDIEGGVQSTRSDGFVP